MNVTLTENEEKNGVELRFDAKPSATIREQLKETGFRWSFNQGLWYAKRNDRTLSFARSLISRHIATSATVAPMVSAF